MTTCDEVCFDLTKLLGGEVLWDWIEMVIRRCAATRDDTVRVQPEHHVLDGRQYVPHPHLLGHEIRYCIGAWNNIAIKTLDNLNSSAFDRFHLLRVVGQKSYLGDTKESKNVRWQDKVTQIRILTQTLVRFDSVEPLILQFVGSEFRHQPDSPTLLALIDHDPRAFFGDSLHGP